MSTTTLNQLAQLVLKVSKKADKSWKPGMAMTRCISDAAMQICKTKPEKDLVCLLLVVCWNDIIEWAVKTVARPNTPRMPIMDMHKE